MNVSVKAIVLSCALIMQVLAAHSASGGMDLHSAARKGKVSRVQTLLNADPHNVNSTDQDGLTALHHAAHKGHLSVVRLLLGISANVNATTKEKLTPLHYAAYKGHMEIVRLLLDAGADHTATDKNGATPLGEAAQAGHAEVVRELLNRGARLTDQVKRCSLLQKDNRKLLKECETLVEQRIKEISTPETRLINNAEIEPQEGSTPLREEIGNHTHATEAPPSLLEICDRHRSLYSAARVGDVETLQRLLEAGAEVNTAQPWRRETALHYAAGKGHVLVVQLLLKAGADYTSTSRFGSTPLHTAAANDQVKTIQLLLDAGADVNATEKGDGSTPLCSAANRNQVAAARLLLKAGANHRATNKDGLTPLHLATERITGAELAQELVARGAKLTTQIKGYRALQHDNQALLKRCERLIEQRASVIQEFLTELIDAGIDIISFLEKECDTRLHSAVLTGNINEIKRLLQSGAEVNAMELDRWTPLHVAAHTGHAKAVELVIKNGAKLEAADSNGHTALHITAEKGRAKAMKSLLNAGAKPNAKDIVGRTPLIIALIGDQEVVLPILLKAGADPRAAMRGGLTPLSIAKRKRPLVHWLVAGYASQPPHLVLQDHPHHHRKSIRTLNTPETHIRKSTSSASQSKPRWQRLVSCFNRTHCNKD